MPTAPPPHLRVRTRGKQSASRIKRARVRGRKRAEWTYATVPVIKSDGAALSLLSNTHVITHWTNEFTTLSHQLYYSAAATVSITSTKVGKP